MDQTLEQQIRLADSFAQRYFAALSRLRYHSNGDTGVDTDLFSSKKKNLLIASVSTFAICGTLAIFYPVEAAVIGMLAIGVLGKAYLVQRKYLR